MKKKIWLGFNFIFLFAQLFTIALCVYIVDPYFHYHEPRIDKYYYELDSERPQNNGILRNFDYDAIITGTSMTNNFKTSEMDEIFGTKSVKVSYSSGTYKEINDNISVALKNNPQLKTVIRGLDMLFFFSDSNEEKDIAHAYDYLYDENIFNDYNYVFNKTVIKKTCIMIGNHLKGISGGITTFDSYGDWSKKVKYGINELRIQDKHQMDGKCYNAHMQNIYPENYLHLSEEDKEVISDNIRKNVSDIVEQYPEVDFYYFFTPYSIVWWNSEMITGNIYRQIEAEQYIIELLLQYENIHLYSFNNVTHITTDLNNYKDAMHYGDWINSFMLKSIQNGEYELTEDNYKEYIEHELLFYSTCDYEQLNYQEDYEDDRKAEVLLESWKGTGRAEDNNP